MCNEMFCFDMYTNKYLINLINNWSITYLSVREERLLYSIWCVQLYPHDLHQSPAVQKCPIFHTLTQTSKLLDKSLCSQRIDSANNDNNYIIWFWAMKKEWSSILSLNSNDILSTVILQVSNKPKRSGPTKRLDIVK